MPEQKRLFWNNLPMNEESIALTKHDDEPVDDKGLN